MKRLFTAWALLALAAMAIALEGCSRATRESMKRDVNEAARDVDRAF